MNALGRHVAYIQKSLTMTGEERAHARRAREAFREIPAKSTLDSATALLLRLSRVAAAMQNQRS